MFSFCIYLHCVILFLYCSTLNLLQHYREVSEHLHGLIILPQGKGPMVHKEQKIGSSLCCSVEKNPCVLD
jgi:hypothetical protein